jgi:hypothetical protein
MHALHHLLFSSRSIAVLSHLLESMSCPLQDLRCSEMNHAPGCGLIPVNNPEYRRLTGNYEAQDLSSGVERSLSEDSAVRASQHLSEGPSTLGRTLEFLF